MLQNLPSKRAGFTLVEIMIVVAIIALLAAIAVPNFLRSRKRSQATAILEDLRQIDAALDQYSIEYRKAPNSDATWTDLQIYIKSGTRLYSSGCRDILGNAFGAVDDTGTGTGTAFTFRVDNKIGVCRITFDAFSDVAPADFWSPFAPATF